jgi:hypothetical protein
LAGAQTVKYYLRGNGTNVVMAAIVAGDVPTLNQDTTGSSGSCTGNAATATSAAACSGNSATASALNTTFTSGRVLYGDGTGLPVTSASLTYSSGTLTCGGDVVAYSDRNIKTNIEPILDALEKVSRIGGYTFNRTDGDSERRTGVIAQEVQEVLPEAVHTTENGTLTVAYGNMVGLLIEAIKELRAEVTELKRRSNTPTQGE